MPLLRYAYTPIRYAVNSLATGLTPQDVLPAPGASVRYIIESISVSFLPATPGTAQVVLFSVAFEDEISPTLFAVFAGSLTNVFTCQTQYFGAGYGVPKSHPNKKLQLVSVVTGGGAGTINVHLTGAIETEVSSPD